MLFKPRTGISSVYSPGGDLDKSSTASFLIFFLFRKNLERVSFNFNEEKYEIIYFALTFVSLVELSPWLKRPLLQSRSSLQLLCYFCH